MAFALGFVTFFGMIIGHLAMKKGNRKLGTIQTLLNVIMVLFTTLFCISKYYYNYNGSNEDYLFSRALSGSSIEPWILLIVFIILEVITYINLFDLMHIKDSKKRKFLKQLKKFDIL